MVYETSYPNFLEHYGVKGMKWGVIRDPDYRKDKKQLTTLKRHVAASKNYLKTRSDLHKPSEDLYTKAEKKLNKELTRPSLSRKKKNERIKEATDELRTAGESRDKTLSELSRAERIYKESAEAYISHITNMINKYSDINIKDVSYQNVKYGKDVVDKVIKTGITVADVPIIGSYYTGKYISTKDSEDRRKTQKSNASRS